MPINPLGLLPFYTGTTGAESRPPQFRTLQISSSGLSAQLQRMEVIATNIANAETTRVGEAGSGPYRRKVLRYEEATAPGAPAQVPPLPPLPPATTEETTPPDPTLALGGVNAAAIEE